MKIRIITLLFLLFCSYAGMYAQTPTKAEIKAQKRAEKAEARRIQDSIWNAQNAEQIQAEIKEEMRKNANTLIVTTTYETRDEAFNTIINALLDAGYIIGEKDKEFYTIKTEQKDAGLAKYDLLFRAKEQDKKVLVEISGRVHGAIALYGVIRTFSEPLVNKGVQGSANKVGFAEMLRFANLLPHSHIDYIVR